MSKTLVIAEKPSVGRDLARVLDGPFEKGEGYLEGPQHLVTWAVGHLVQLAEPDEYDPKYKRWKMEDLPIVPEHFKLVVRDERSRKQMSVVSRQLAREDIEEVVNACDAGREGELIFAYLYEKAKGKKPVRRLWLNSMTTAAMKAAFSSLRPAGEFELLEEAEAIVAAVEGGTGAITKLEKTERKERPPFLYDLTSLQRDASS
ncbi:MAG TPA: toprim domain-containing protein, partial [Solirubrobacteraceae bacterium]|nr:toprim domain-containing protein [Solirubrobacteraceae bacterium]